MPFEHYIHQGAKRLRCGYTTGSCAALASKAAAQILLTGEAAKTVSLTTPKGLPVTAEVLNVRQTSDSVSCAVQKDAGDDWDATDGVLVYAEVRRTDSGIQIDGGAGVGRVTLAGLNQPVGAAAINAGPRRMIAEALSEICEKSGYPGGLSVLISIPGGEELARKTFNPRLGITGGLSILGTSGIVEPQSLQALVASIEVEIKMQAAQGEKRLILTPGNYGEAFLTQYPLPPEIPQVKCSNFIGDCLDFAAQNGFTEVLLVGHIGKLGKLAGGIMNTHSRFADCRTELFAAHAAACGASQSAILQILEAATSEACITLLDEENLREPVLNRMAEAIQRHLDFRAAEVFSVGAVLFSTVHGLLAETSGAKVLLEKWRQHG